ncbi:FAD-dependent oxidoreductase [Leucobacter ruminantium]|uniref:L-aspartate oxidase n=1 Tax=Leucobacter ruminantium TaxID=1289170 RepID=A0A939RYJ6_9MICO|nr:FAD-binding protein [Leucobacter ruminantium]
MILVIGTGVAGLSCALAAAAAGADVELVSPGELAADATDSASGLAGGNTALAQGGIAAVLGRDDTLSAHVSDTRAAGAGLVDAEAAEALVGDGSALVRRLLEAGFPADRDENGRPRLGLEAAHSAARILHAGGDRSGAALHAFLTARVLAAAGEGRIVPRSGVVAVSLLQDGGTVAGAVLRDASGALAVHRADAVVLATGGYAALYPRTSNHPAARGRGIVLAAQAGALVADLEFVQFHPTVLHGTGALVSEAVRGAGAVLLDGAGRRFLVDTARVGSDPRAELAPRDVVSREIHRVLRERGEACVWLDATGIEEREGRGALARRFPGISASIAREGFDWAREPVPVSPAAHYTMGGVVSDLDGRSTVPGLFVSGEVASTGVHGANRLASNSLLEGLVFGERAGRAAAARSLCTGTGRESETGAGWALRGSGVRRLVAEAETERLRLAPGTEGLPDGHAAEAADHDARTRVSRLVADGLGIERDAQGLHFVSAAIEGEVGADAALAAMMVRFAESRTESRGAHQRADRPDTDPRQSSRRALRFAVRPGAEASGGPARREPAVLNA